MRIMRRWVAACCVLSMSSAAHAADVATSSNVENVTVFLSGAEVTRAAKLKLDAGTHTIVIEDVPVTAVPGSIRVEGKATGKLEIVSVDTQRKFLQREDSRAANVERKQIEDQIEALQDTRGAIEAKINAADTQMALISNLAQLPTRPAPAAGAAPAEDWLRIMSLIPEGMTEASRLKKEGEVALRTLDRQILDLNAKLAALAPAQTEQTEVRVNVAAETQLDADLTVRYQVQEARWTPIYDVRLTTASKTEAAKMPLSRRAAISQQTGERWNDVTVQLSTARPADGAAAPDLGTQTVDYPAPPQPIARVRKYSAPAATAAAREEAADAMAEPQALGHGVAPAMAPAPVVEQTAAVINAPFEATFAVPGKVTIDSNGEVKRVALMTDLIEPVMSSRTVPKFDSNAYLYATFKLAKGTPLLPGAAYLFRDGTFVGTTHLPLLPPGVEHHLGFGIDDQIKVRYAVIEEKIGETGLISTSRTESRNVRVTVKNLHARPIPLQIFDRVPVSKNQQIKVEMTGKAPTRVDIDDKKGVFVFEEELNAEEEQVFEYGYRVVWPAEKSVEYSP